MMFSDLVKIADSQNCYCCITLTALISGLLRVPIIVDFYKSTEKTTLLLFRKHRDEEWRPNAEKIALGNKRKLGSGRRM